MKTQPRVQCKNCRKEFTANYSRLVKHIVGTGDIASCEPMEPSVEFEQLRSKLAEEVASKERGKEQRQADCDVARAADKADNDAALAKGGMQPDIQSSLARVTSEMCDDAIADFFYGDNISSHVAASPRFKAMIKKLKCAPLNYKPPSDRRLNNDLLLSSTARLQSEQAPLKSAVLESSGTIVSDGWDDIEQNHLINFLIGTAKGMFFDGTVELTVSVSF